MCAQAHQVTVGQFVSDVPAQHQFGAGLVVELRGDVQALGLGEDVAGAKLSVSVLVRPELKFQPGYSFPCWLHVSDVSHEVLVLLTRHLSNLQ